MEKTKKIRGNLLLYIAGGAIISAFTYGIYYLFKKRSEIKLNEWLEAYLKEIKDKIKNNTERDFNIEILCHIHNLIAEIDDYIFIQKYSSLEEDRLDNLENSDAYLDLLVECINTRNLTYNLSSNFVYKNLETTAENINNLINKEDIQYYKKVLNTTKKKYREKDLPRVSADAVKEAFIFYVKGKQKNELFEKQQEFIMNSSADYIMMAKIKFVASKMKLCDQVKIQWGIDEKYFDQLIEKYNLLKDGEVLRCYEDMKYLS